MEFFKFGAPGDRTHRQCFKFESRGHFWAVVGLSAVGREEATKTFVGAASLRLLAVCDRSCVRVTIELFIKTE